MNIMDLCKPHVVFNLFPLSGPKKELVMGIPWGPAPNTVM